MYLSKNNNQRNVRFLVQGCYDELRVLFDDEVNDITESVFHCIEENASIFRVFDTEVQLFPTNVIASCITFGYTKRRPNQIDIAYLNTNQRCTQLLNFLSFVTSPLLILYFKVVQHLN